MDLKETFDLFGRLTVAVAERYARLTSADSAATAAADAEARGGNGGGSANGGGNRSGGGGGGSQAAYPSAQHPEPLVPPTLAEYNLKVTPLHHNPVIHPKPETRNPKP